MKVTNYELFYNPSLDNIEVLNPNEMVGIPKEAWEHEKKSKARNI